MARPVRPTRGWQRMLSGRRLDILDPSPLDVELDDIAHGLARVARWNGQTRGPHPFCVAQHSCLVEGIAAALDPTLDGRGRLTALLHDAAEYVVGDMITPLKGELGPAFEAMESRLMAAIHRAFGLPVAVPPGLARLVKTADRIAALAEATALAGFTPAEARATFGEPGPLPPGLADALRPLSPAEAEAAFRVRVLACTATQPVRHPAAL